MGAPVGKLGGAQINQNYLDWHMRPEVYIIKHTHATQIATFHARTRSREGLRR
jgi:hypothetical protein